LTLFLTPKGVGIGREKGVAFGCDLTLLLMVYGDGRGLSALLAPATLRGSEKSRALVAWRTIQPMPRRFERPSHYRYGKQYQRASGTEKISMR
ncbi:hypothetical protein, partial [Acidiphilium sp.]